MPTREVLASFWRGWDRPTPHQPRAFREAVVQFVADLADGDRPTRSVLRWLRLDQYLMQTYKIVGDLLIADDRSAILG